MKTYKLTAYEPTGKLIMDDSLEASTDEKAKELLETTHRLTSPTGKLVLFHT